MFSNQHQETLEYEISIDIVRYAYADDDCLFMLNFYSNRPYWISQKDINQVLLFREAIHGLGSGGALMNSLGQLVHLFPSSIIVADFCTIRERILNRTRLWKTSTRIREIKHNKQLSYLVGNNVEIGQGTCRQFRAGIHCKVTNGGGMGSGILRILFLCKECGAFFNWKSFIALNNVAKGTAPLFVSDKYLFRNVAFILDDEEVAIKLPPVDLRDRKKQIMFFHLMLLEFYILVMRQLLPFRVVNVVQRKKRQTRSPWFHRPKTRLQTQATGVAYSSLMTNG
ncbi:hypothetical protein L2E82_41815 [Cichorium intybus]|uniref:Uncharacterized protein n=1 Tax=Cichorium intybus TaxID=13427 RepID=A0ACB8ZLZ6_CICIN|nr:hypothetical protein L2E82_41815 [Cichorium intybus]